MDTHQDEHSTADFANQTYIVYLLLVIIFAIHVYGLQLEDFDRYQIYYDYANSKPEIVEGEYYRLFTSMFLHVDLGHLISNGLGLFIFGTTIEQLFGHTRFLLIYILGGLAGSLASFVISGGSSVGASGAVFAVFGALAAYFLTHRNLYGKVAIQQLRSMAVLAAINLAIGVASNVVPGSTIRIDNAAHVGGAIGGLLLAWWISPRYERRMGINTMGQPFEQLIDTSRLSRWLPAVGIYVLVLVAILVAALRG